MPSIYMFIFQLRQTVMRRFRHNAFNHAIFDAFYTYLVTNNELYKVYVRMQAVLDEQVRLRGSDAEVTLVFKQPNAQPGDHQLRGNAESVPILENEVAALYTTKGVPMAPTIYVHRNGREFPIYDTNPLREAFTYPVVHPNGEPGWRPGVPQNDVARRTAERNKVTCAQFYMLELCTFI
jgi:hypothetical protein